MVGLRRSCTYEIWPTDIFGSSEHFAMYACSIVSDDSESRETFAVLRSTVSEVQYIWKYRLSNSLDLPRTCQAEVLRSSCCRPGQLLLCGSPMLCCNTCNFAILSG